MNGSIDRSIETKPKMRSLLLVLGSISLGQQASDKKRASIVCLSFFVLDARVACDVLLLRAIGGGDGGRVNMTRKVAFLTRTRSSRSVPNSVLCSLPYVHLTMNHVNHVRYKPPYHPQKTRVKPPEVMRTDDIHKDILGGKYGYLCSSLPDGSRRK